MRMVSLGVQPVKPIESIGPTNRERAQKTYEELQKRKQKKNQKLENDIHAFMVDSFYKCLNTRHDLKVYR